MSPQAQLVMLLWFPIVLYLFNRFPTQKAVIIGFIVAWLFLPQRAGWALPGIPDYERMSATCYGILIATAIFDGQRFTNFKFSWFDLPMAIWCICPLFSSITNNLGIYDGLSSSLTQTVQYGFPYFLGRIYLYNLSGLRQLAWSILISGLIYAPLCLYESRMSPQLHRIVYGYLGIIDFSQSYRLGGYRPNVFMNHGLSVGMWMMAVTLIAFWFWKAKIVKKIWNIPINQLLIGLTITFILVRSTGAYVYLLFGLFVMFTAKLFRINWPLLILVFSLSFYLYLGATGKFTPKMSDQVFDVVLNITKSEERAGSLKYRLDNEQILVERALQRPIFGWGGWDRNNVFKENSRGEIVKATVTDSLWIIAFGQRGWVGLISLFAVSLLPACYFIFRYPSRLWFHPYLAPAAVLTVVLVLYMLDNVLNNMYNPVFVLASGGLVGMLQLQPKLNKPKSKQIKQNLKVRSQNAKLKT